MRRAKTHLDEMSSLSILSPSHCCCNDVSDSFRRLDEVPIGKVRVARRGPVLPMAEQLADQGQILARHNGVTGGGMAQIMQP